MITNDEVGTVIKAYNGYYYVKGDSKEVFACKLRGRLKKERFSLMTGDKVSFIPPVSIDGEGSIESILPRKNNLIRPLVANVDQQILVFAVKNPDLNLSTLDRFLVTAEQSDVPIVLCFSKVDLLYDLLEIEKINILYQMIGYKIILLSTNTKQGIDELQKLMAGKTTAFAGLSGVGKSTLLNTLYPDLNLATGEVSEKNNKGKHTTRFSQLLAVENGYVVDTPGFSFAEMIGFTEKEVEQAFIEFAQFSNSCRFTTCIHVSEPSCGVKDAVNSGAIAQSRYANYLEIIEEIRMNKGRKK